MKFWYVKIMYAPKRKHNQRKSIPVVLWRKTTTTLCMAFNCGQTLSLNIKSVGTPKQWLKAVDRDWRGIFQRGVRRGPDSLRVGILATICLIFHFSLLSRKRWKRKKWKSVTLMGLFNLVAFYQMYFLSYLILDFSNKFDYNMPSISAQISCKRSVYLDINLKWFCFLINIR